MLTITGYDDLRAIGRGGFGVVYQGRDRRFARDVAVKVLNGTLDETMTARFERECHAVGALSGHPHIVVVHDSGTTDEGRVYLVMELLSGGSLADRLASSGPQPWPTAAELGVQLGGALETAHRGGVLHRDVKPENVLFSAYRQPKLVDFGIATVRGGFETKSASVSASLAHAAPEILAGKRSSTASDVYALGSTLFQVLTGHPAFVEPEDETLFPLLARISSDPVPDLRLQGVPDRVASVIEKAMAKAPEDRHASALEFALALQQAGLAHGQVLSSPVVMGEDTSVPASPAGAVTTHHAAITPVLSERVPTVPAPARRRRALIAVTAAVALVAAGAVVLLQQGDRAKPVSYAFASAQDSTISAARTWSLDAKGTALTSDLALTNMGSAPITRTAIEVIPKVVASSVSTIVFAPADVTVVDGDPVVRRSVTLAGKQTVHHRWTVRLSSSATMSDLRSMAAEQRSAEQALRPRLASIAAAAHVSVASLVPFPGASLPDPGLTSPPTASPTFATTPTVTSSAAPAPVPGATTSPRSGAVATTAPVASTSAPAVNHPPTLGAIANRSVDERVVVSIALAGSDPDGDRLTYAVSGALPSGIALSGNTIRGTVSVAAVSLTRTKTNLISKAFTVTVTVRDVHGAAASRSLRITVRDTHIVLPSYIGYYGCRGDQVCDDPPSLPGVSQISQPNFSCVIDDSKPAGTIAAQSVPPGTLFRWGSGVVWTYNAKSSTGCPA